MSETNTIKARPAIGLKKLVIWKMTDETENSVTYSTTAVEISKRLMTAKFTPNVATAALEADNQQVEGISCVDGGALEIGVTSLTSLERAEFYGETIDNGTNVTNIDDISNNLCVAYMTTRSDGLVNLYKYPKVYFTPGEETSETKKKGGITYQTATLKGEALSSVSDGNCRYVRYGVDPNNTADKEIISSWFATAEYYKPDSENQI